MKTHSYEVVKEYVFFPEILGHSVRGRIVKNLDAESSLPYMWQISHRWKPAEGAGFYYPSVNSGKDFKTVEQLLFAYAKSFTETVKVDDNY
jgi:hypothetical protein